MRCATCKMDQGTISIWSRLNKNKKDGAQGPYRYGPRTRLTIHSTKVKTTSNFTRFGESLPSVFPPTPNIIQMADRRWPAIVRHLNIFPLNNCWWRVAYRTRCFWGARGGLLLRMRNVLGITMYHRVFGFMSDVFRSYISRIRLQIGWSVSFWGPSNLAKKEQ